MKGDVEGKEKAKIVVMKWAKRRKRRSKLTNLRVKYYNSQKLGYFAYV